MSNCWKICRINTINLYRLLLRKMHRVSEFTFKFFPIEKPLLISDVRLQEVRRHGGLASSLKSPRSSLVYVSMDLDIWRYVTYRKGKPLEHKGHIMLEKNDLERLKYLPHQWWSYLNVHGEGLSIDFPMKIKQLLTWSAAHYCKRDGKL